MQKYAIPRILRDRRSTISCQSVYDPKKFDKNIDVIQCSINLVPNINDNWDKYKRGLKTAVVNAVSTFQFEVNTTDNFSINVLGLCDEKNVNCNIKKEEPKLVKPPAGLVPPPPPQKQVQKEQVPTVDANDIAKKLFDLMKKEGVVVAGERIEFTQSENPEELQRRKEEEKAREIKRREARSKMESAKEELISELAFNVKFRSATNKKECESLVLIEEPIPNESQKDKENREKRNKMAENIIPIWIKEPVRAGQGMCLGFDTKIGITIPKLDSEEKCNIFSKLSSEYPQLKKWDASWKSTTSIVERKVPMPRYTQADLDAEIEAIKSDPKINPTLKPELIQEKIEIGKELMKKPQEFEIKKFEIKEGQCIITQK